MQKNKFYLYVAILTSLTGCSKFCSYRDNIEIPCEWHSASMNEVSLDNPKGFRWWESLNDCQLNELIEEAPCKNSDVQLAAAISCERKLEAVNSTTADIAKNYILLRGLQKQLDVSQKHIEDQEKTILLGEGLSKAGFINTIDKNENKRILDAYQFEKETLKLSIDKTIFHISTQLGYAPGGLYDCLICQKELTGFPCYIPVGTPMDLLCRHPLVREARKAYNKTQNKLAFFNYKKEVLNALEQTEGALATLHYDLEKNREKVSSFKLKEEAYKLSEDLFHRGLIDERQYQQAHQGLLTAENELILIQLQLLLDYIELYRTLEVGACI